jgi:hypothetical protein
MSLRNTHHQGALAEAIFAGLRGYFSANPPVGTRFAQSRRGTTVASALTPSPVDASGGAPAR